MSEPPSATLIEQLEAAEAFEAAVKKFKASLLLTAKHRQELMDTMANNQHVIVEPCEEYVRHIALSVRGRGRGSRSRSHGRGADPSSRRAVPALSIGDILDQTGCGCGNGANCCLNLVAPSATPSSASTASIAEVKETEGKKSDPR